jgi:hypothetical protein NreA
MHESHPKIVARLRRAEGHLRAVIGMIEAEKPCLELAQQLHAVEAAVAKAKKELIQDHIEHCLEDADREGRAVIGELKQLAKFL